MQTDYFGRPFKVGQRLLHLSRRGSQLVLEERIVTKLADDGAPFIQSSRTDWRKTRPTLSRRPDRLIIYPEDA